MKIKSHNIFRGLAIKTTEVETQIDPFDGSVMQVIRVVLEHLWSIIKFTWTILPAIAGWFVWFPGGSGGKSFKILKAVNHGPLIRLWPIRLF